MYPTTVAVLLLVLTGIFFWRWWSTHLRHKTLPPGPVPLPVIGSLHLLGSLPHRSLHKLSQKYGPIMSVRLGSVQFVIVSSPDAAKLFLGTHDIVFASRPQIQAVKYLSYDNKGMTFSEYWPYWRSVRKFCTMELLSATKLNGFAGMRREEIGLMVEEMKAAANARKVVNLSETVSWVIEGMVCSRVGCCLARKMMRGLFSRLLLIRAWKQRVYSIWLIMCLCWLRLIFR
ncbi:putative angelicin synthase [Helianthus annuus]|nr:putative angelicin synthase [Helianthus annuus]